MFPQFTFSLLLLVSLSKCSPTKNIVGPVGNIVLTLLEICPFENKLQTEFNINLKKVNGSQWVEGELKLPFDIDDNIMFKISFDKWTGSEWKERYHKGEGSFCKYERKYFQQLYRKLAAAFHPEFPSDCPILKNKIKQVYKCLLQGHYKAEKISLEVADIDFPSILYGKFRIIFTGYKGNSTIWCVESHLTSTAK